MTNQLTIRLALGGLLLVGAAACNGDDKNAADGASSTPTATGSPTTPASSAAAPTTSAPPTPRATITGPKITKSKQIVLIDPDGKKYTFTTMVQMAAGMRATMGENAPSGFCEQSYRQGVEEGGKFPAGKTAFMAACREGWRKGARPPG